MQKRRGWMIAAAAVAALGVVTLAGGWIWQGICQLLWGAGAALLALPFARRLERSFSPGASAALALVLSAAVLMAALLLVLPPLLSQLRHFFQLLPGLLEAAGEVFQRGQRWLAAHGLPVEGSVQNLLENGGKQLLDEAAPAVAQWLGGVAGGISHWMLAPVFAFYLLRDRRRIARRIWLLLPARRRGGVRRALSEMRREVSGFLRGQLLISAAVGGLTAVGLLFCGVEAWLALGLVMGILELIPYAGPFLGGLLAVLFSLPGGLSRVLWTLGVVIAVQQAEGSVLSPRLLSAATQLHPLSLILCITLGSAAAGLWGMLLSVPLLLCARAALRVMGEERRMEIFHR